MCTRLSKKLRNALALMQKKNGITSDQFFAIIESDPTALNGDGELKTDKGRVIGGKYTNWLFKYSIPLVIPIGTETICPSLMGRFLQEDIVKTTADLKYYKNNISKFPKDERDINRLTKLETATSTNPFVELYRVVERVRQNQTASQLKKIALKQSIELATGNPDKRVFIPLTMEASIYLGMMTRWCTAATESNNVFDSYFEKGYLYYVFIRNGVIEKFAFHFEDGAYFDELDEPIDDVQGFFKEHQEVADAIAKHRVSVKDAKDCAGDLILLNQPLPKGLTREDVKDISQWYIYGAVQSGQLSSEEGNALLPEDFNFKFHSENDAKIVVKDWDDLKHFANWNKCDLSEYLNGEAYECFDYGLSEPSELINMLDDESEELLVEKLNIPDDVEWDSEVIEEYLTQECLDEMNYALNDAMKSAEHEARIKAARDAVRQTLSITSDRQVQIDGEWKLEITVEPVLLSIIRNVYGEFDSIYNYSYLDLLCELDDVETYSPDLPEYTDWSEETYNKIVRDRLNEI